MALPPEARRPKPKTRKKAPKKKPYTLPKTFRPAVQTDRRPTPKKGPPSPQRTGRPVTKQPVTRKRDAAPTTTDRSSDSSRSPAQKARDRRAVARNVAQARRDALRKPVRGRGVRVDPRRLPHPISPVELAKRNAALREGFSAENLGRRSAVAKRAQAQKLAPVLKALEQTSRPIHAVAAAAREDVRDIKAGRLPVGQGSLSAAKRGFELKDKSLFSDVLEEAGVHNKIVKGVGGFALDVALDPLTHGRAGLASPAEAAARNASRKAAKKTVKSAGAKTAQVKAAEQASKRGASAKVAKRAGKAAAKTHARRAGAKAGAKAAEGKATNRGVSIRFGRTEVTPVTKATAAVKRAPRKVADKTRVSGTKADRAQQRVRDASRNLASDFSPNVTPAGVNRAEYQAARRAARTARAEAQQGTFDAGQRAIAYRKAIGEKNYSKVIDAIENGTVKDLPKDLKTGARSLERDFAHMRKAENRAGIKTPERKNYIKHLRIKDEDRRASSGVGSGKVRPDFLKQRREGTIREKNTAEPGAYSEDIADIYLNRAAKSSVSRAKAKLNQSMVNAGRKPVKGVTIKDQLGDNESLYRIEGSDLVKVAPDSSEAKFLGEGWDAQRKELAAKLKAQGKSKEDIAKALGKLKKRNPNPNAKHVILNDKVLSRTRGTVASAAERSTTGVFFDKAQGVWKLAATQVNPGFHLRNFAGEAQNAYLATDNALVLGKNAVQARQALKQLGRNEDAARVLGKTAKGAGSERDKFIRDAKNVGAVRAGQVGREIQEMLGSASRKAGPRKAKARTIARKPVRILKNIEDVFRLATYKEGIDKGLSPEKALERASTHHFDYGDVTPLERTVLRRVAPFWTFSSRNIPLQAKMLIQRPGKFAQYQKVREEIQKAFGVPTDSDQKDLTEYEQRSAPISFKIGDKTFNISLGPSGLPLTDLNEFPTTADPIKQADEWMDRAMSLLTPAAKTPVELWSNFSFFFRDQIEHDEGPLAPAPSWVSAIPKKYRKDLGIVPDYVDKRTGKKQWGAPAKVVYALGVLPGPFNFANRLVTPSERPGQDPASKVLAYSGVRVRQNDPVGKQINDLYDERAKVQKQAAALRQRGVNAANPTPEYRKLLDQTKSLTSDIFRLKNKRGDVDARNGGRKATAGGFNWPDKGGGFKWPDK